MAKMTVTPDPQCPLYVNVSGSVGNGGINQREDCALVWFFLRVASTKAKDPGARMALQRMPPVMTSTAALGTYITALQTALRKKVDGRVDVGPAYGADYLIMNLNVVCRRGYPSQYPRLDLMPESNGEIAQIVARLITGAG